MNYEIRTLTTIEELREHERLQREVWGSDATDVPVPLLAAGARHGAVLLGAYSGAEMVGILYGFPALTDGRRHHHSHMLGVLPAYRRRGIALALKLRQREIVRAQGLEEITWTVDPLEAPNNLFNFGRLGVTCDTYLVDAYGEMEDALNRGLPSDRLEVRWWVGEPEAAPRPRAVTDIPPGARSLAAVGTDEQRGVPVPGSLGALEGPALLVDAPLDYRAVRAADPALALRWRLHLRELFLTAFAEGYTLVGCVRRGDLGTYVLRRDSR